MRTRVIFILCCISCFILASCKEHCHGFPEYFTDYFPYKIGDTLLFVNQNNDTISLQVKVVHKDREYTTGKCGKCGGCDNPFYIVAIGPADILIYVVIAKKSYFRININDFYWDGVATSESTLYIYDESGKNPFDPKNSALFGETVTIEDNTMQISRVVIVKGKGITEFYDQKYDFQWKSINK